jgi:hypothetical protein
MRNTAERIVLLTEELRALQAQLKWSAFQKASRDDKTKMLDGLLNSGLVEDLKTAVDNLSGFLWCYINSVAAAHSIVESDNEAQSKRLGQITDMLRTLRQPAFAGEDASGFLERITASVDQHLEACEPEFAARRSA